MLGEQGHPVSRTHARSTAQPSVSAVSSKPECLRLARFSVEVCYVQESQASGVLVL